MLKLEMKQLTLLLIVRPPTNSTLEPSPVTIGIKANTVVPVAVMVL